MTKAKQKIDAAIEEYPKFTDDLLKFLEYHQKHHDVLQTSFKALRALCDEPEPIKITPLEYWITEDELDKVWGNANFGENANRRLIILDTLLKVACNFGTGHTAIEICKALGLIGKSGALLTKRGRRVMYYLNKELPRTSPAQAIADEFMKGMDDE